MYIWNKSLYQDDYQHIADWIFRSAATLEVMEFMMNDRNWSSIQYPWSLQRKHTDPDSRYDPRPPQYFPKALLEDLVRPSFAWQCTELESLDLSVRDTAPPPLPPPCTDGNTSEINSNPEQESDLLVQEKIEQARWKFADEVAQLLWRLKDLSKLTNLKLEWTLSKAVSTMALEDLLVMINVEVMEEEEEYEHTPAIKVKKVMDKAGSKRKVVTQDDLTWLGLGSAFWTRLDIESYTKELEALSLSEVPPHDFDNTEHPLHRRVGHGWKDWDAFIRAKGDIYFAYSEDPLESMAQFDAMSKKFEAPRSPVPLSLADYCGKTNKNHTHTLHNNTSQSMSLFKRSNKNKIASDAPTPVQSPRASMQSSNARFAGPLTGDVPISTHPSVDDATMLILLQLSDINPEERTRDNNAKVLKALQLDLA
ncbi:hypothetical protein BGX24_010535 [Mortierella sp. AD032]|nr:hypothetical protein BGX24_010535 [Mortierella sp. AD032]